MSAVVTLWQMPSIRQAVSSLLKKSVTLYSIWLSSERLLIFLTSVFCISIIFKYSSIRFGGEIYQYPPNLCRFIITEYQQGYKPLSHWETKGESQGRRPVWIHGGFCCSFAVLCIGYRISLMLCKFVTTELYPQPLCHLWISRVSGTWLELWTLTP